MIREWRIINQSKLHLSVAQTSRLRPLADQEVCPTLGLTHLKSALASLLILDLLSSILDPVGKGL